MLDENEYVALWIRRKDKQRLLDKKVHHKQPYYEVVEKLLDKYDENEWK